MLSYLSWRANVLFIRKKGKKKGNDVISELLYGKTASGTVAIGATCTQGKRKKELESGFTKREFKGTLGIGDWLSLGDKYRPIGKMGRKELKGRGYQ